MAKLTVMYNIFTKYGILSILNAPCMLRNIHNDAMFTNDIYNRIII